MRWVDQCGAVHASTFAFVVFAQQGVLWNGRLLACQCCSLLFSMFMCYVGPRYGDSDSRQIPMCNMGAKGYLWLWRMVVDLTTDGDVWPKLACCSRYFRYDIDFSSHARATVEALQLVEFWCFPESWWFGSGFEGYRRCDCCFCICDFQPCGCVCVHCCFNSLRFIPYLDSDIEYWSDYRIALLSSLMWT